MKILTGWYQGIIYPFKENDWKSKMWLIPLLGVILTPFFELLVLRGWRVELVRRIGLGVNKILPPADISAVIKYALHGIKLYLITGIYIVVPVIILRLFGINPFRQIFIELGHIIGYLWSNDTGIPITTLLWNSFWVIVKEFFIDNIWLVVYYPYYRAATIRYALIGRFRKSHLAFSANISFVLRNVKAFVMLMINQVIDKFILFFVNFIIAIILTPIIGGLLAPLFLFYADFWTSGYEYGEIAIKMAEQEYPHLLEEDVVESAIV